MRSGAVHTSVTAGVPWRVARVLELVLPTLVLPREAAPSSQRRPPRLAKPEGGERGPRAAMPAPRPLPRRGRCTGARRICLICCMRQRRLRGMEDLASRGMGRAILPFTCRVTTAASICSALNYLHRNNHKPIIHGDLKPRNVYFTADNICKLRNFGISSLLHPTKHVSSAIEEVIQGMPGEKDIQGIFRILMDTDGCKIQIQTDVSALGTILLQLVTGRSDAKGLRDYVAEKLGDDREFQRKSIVQKREILKGIVDPELKRCQTPVEGAARMLFLGLRFSDPKGKQCPRIACEVLPQIESMHNTAYSHSQMVWVHRFFF